MVEKAQQYYVFIETVEQIGISEIILKRFHYAMIENVLTFSITVWFGRASYEEKAQLETLVKCTSKIIRLTLPTIESVYHTRCMRKSKNIVRDATHPANHLFERLPSGNGVARIFFWGGPIFRDLRRPTRFGGGGGSSRNIPGSP